MRPGKSLFCPLFLAAILLSPAAAAQTQETDATREAVEAKREELREINAIESLEERRERLEEFLEANPPQSVIPPAYSSLLRTLKEIDPLLAVERADRILAESDAGDSLRRSAYIYKFLAPELPHKPL